MAAPDDLHMLECMLNQLELEHSEDAAGEIAPGMATRVTDRMRMAMRTEAVESNMSILDYIEDTRMALRLSMANPGDDEEESSEDKQHEEDSFISLPDLSIGEDMGVNNSVNSCTGLPQGSDNIAHQGDSLPHTTAIQRDAGTEVITAQTGGSPG